MISLKSFTYCSIGFWAVVALLSIWNVANIRGEWLATAGVLTLTGLLALWVKGS